MAATQPQEVSLQVAACPIAALVADRQADDIGLPNRLS
jgi:hypothetical protein